MVCVSERWGGEGEGRRWGWQAKERRCKEGGEWRRGRGVKGWGREERGGDRISEMPLPPHCLRIDGTERDGGEDLRTLGKGKESKI